MRRRDIEDGRNPLMDHDLKVQRGHTLPEIVIGAALGIMIAVAVCIIL
jgi:acid phosphatase family membrane protein YuiD